MSIGIKKPANKSKKNNAEKSAARKLATEAPEPALHAEPTLPTHVVGKPAEVEPAEYAASPAEAPESGVRSAEAPDAGYGRCTESSDWENRGRS